MRPRRSPPEATAGELLPRSVRHAARATTATPRARAATYRCTNGHGLCGISYPGPECPYCEPAARKRKPAGQFQSEHVLQIAVAQFLDRALPPDAWWSSIDHAGSSLARGRILKGRGVKRGLPDILILAGAPNHYTLWIELKSATGKITKEQTAFCAVARKHAHYTWVCRSVDDVYRFLTTCGIPIRARITA